MLVSINYVMYTMIQTHTVLVTLRYNPNMHINDMYDMMMI